ncbi:SGNH/GDSL hydrolase family protein [Acetobacter pasteurianus]|uniref:SGNH hydrolase-type esterase domain-containing protein n=1 Tax=Acetobacter pasteurianus (strain NBRC 105184 / IFO 3283-01) TaxID=634452 RepID=C7JCC3_ACEP3|nr:SGNH/GDSL hydrolase family protein [Acetobacter pasteurianus]BAH99951.1 hypothetical protein APA01_18260 [Acetobacter pasteurianus IFO 3283-01]BAI03005.1 hypothetical protein APA03_18260 [Acetobacter pasteurianus IFO 3283-03]BAI06050.1 hypothetical protein APA07_18260 [Acetobacter pasteurianus IFO 3283-07]BAI09100.1 hypothetical protein APA22_18260 [Acetobacter pasteurianus IFO 3283-22]BAI12148.1 hypothetical protein APA26_18260 [Acetobacter pasteurianus IFO 3283-26]
MFSPTVRPEHLRQFHKACSSGKAKVMIMGDSIGAVATDPAESENYTYFLIETIMQQNPFVDITFINAALGGASWFQMNADAFSAMNWLDHLSNESWKSYVAREEPDLLILHSGGNDTPNFSPKEVIDLINFFNEQKKPPSIVIAITYAPSYLYNHETAWLNYYTDEWQNALRVTTGWLRSFAINKGLGFLDFYRYMEYCRDGVDVNNVALSKILLTEGDSYFLWDNFISLSDYEWSFPKLRNVNGVSAQKCSDFTHSFSLNKNPRIMSINLSSFPIKDAIINEPNSVHLFFDEPSGYISWSWSDGISPAHENKTMTSIPIPQIWPAKFSVTVKGARVWIRVFSPFKYNQSYDPGILCKYGTGYLDVVNKLLIRFGGDFCPKISFAIPEMQISTHNLCIGSNERNSKDLYRTSRAKNNYDLFKMLGDNPSLIGGSNAYHLNTFGVRDILIPVVQSQMWAAPNIY